MSNTFSVREVRDHLLMSSDARSLLGDGAGSTRLLGQVFHDVYSALISEGSPTHACKAVQDIDPDLPLWRQALLDHAYRRLVGPRLEAMANQLHVHATETQRFWTAVCEMCDWLVEILWGIYQTQGNLDTAKSLAKCEVPMALRLREPGWTNEVVLNGVVDALLRIPGKPAWCIVELKIGQTAPEVDAAQAALYHLIACSTGGQDPCAGTVALVSFKPQRVETLLKAEDLRDATARLKHLIGRMAGVLPNDAGDSAGECPASLSWGMVTDKHEQMKKELLRVLKTHGIAAKISEAPLVGPTFIRFLVEPQTGTRVTAFNGREREIALGMALNHDPKITRIRGRIAIDIERSDRQKVHFSDLRQYFPKPHPLLGNSKVLVGVNLDGSVEFADLAEPEHCHMLVAGTAGSGKSQWLRAAIGSLTETNSPDHLRLILIDPKRNAFTAWRDSPHLLRPIVFPDDTSPIEVLEMLVEEMEARYRRMEGVDDLRQWVIRDGVPEPRILCVCDEYADLVAANKKQRDEIELLLARLGSKARAAGIHLVLATQRPSRDIIRGALNANLPTRIGLTVSSAIEARIIETPGAEHLLNHGDLLFKAIGEPRRLQGAFVSPEELVRISGGTDVLAVG